MVAFELVTLAWLRWRFFHTGFLASFASITLGGLIIVAVSTALGRPWADEPRGARTV